MNTHLIDILNTNQDQELIGMDQLNNKILEHLKLHLIDYSQNNVNYNHIYDSLYLVRN